MKSALMRLTSMPKKGEFWDWWGGLTLAEKILHSIWLTFDISLLLIMILFGLDYLGVLP